MDLARFANAARAYAEDEPVRARPQLGRPAPTAADFTVPCPGCHGVHTTLIAPGESRYKGAMSKVPQRRYCGICKGAVPGLIHRDHRPRELVPASEGW